MTFLRRALVLTLLVVLAVPVAAQAQVATQSPVDVAPGAVSDPADVLDPAGRAALEATLDSFRERTGDRLTVVFVDDFDGLSAQEFADRTAARSNLGDSGPLLVVAERGARPRAALLADPVDYEPETQEDALSALRLAATPVSGAIAVSNELASSVDIVASTGWRWPVTGAAVLLVLAVGAVLLIRRSRRRYERTHHVVDEHGERIDPALLLDDETLEDAADRALVAVDDAILASEQELRRAERASGAATLAGTRAQLQQAADLLAEAFALRAALAEGRPSADRQRRRDASRIITLCEQSADLLDDGLQTVLDARRLGDHLAEATREATGELADLQATDPTDPFATELLTIADSQLATSREHQESGRRRKAVGFLRLAEQTIDIARVVAQEPSGDRGRAAVLTASRRGAISAVARARLRAGTHADADALAQAESDIAGWRPPRGKDVPADLRTLLLAGSLVPAPGKKEFREALGGSTHGSGTNAPFPGSDTVERLVAAGYGGRRATTGRTTIHRM